MTVIKNLIYWAKLVSNLKTIFNIKLKTIKLTLIINDFPNHIADEQIKIAINNIISSSCNGNNNTSSNPKHITLLFRYKMHKRYKFPGIILKI